MRSAKIELTQENFNKLEEIRRTHGNVVFVESENNVIKVQYNNVDIMGGTMEGVFRKAFGENASV